MLRRLVLCSGGTDMSVTRAVAQGRGEEMVLSADTQCVTSLQNTGVSAVESDPTDPGDYPDAVDVVVITGANSSENLAAAKTAAEQFPEAYLFGCLDGDSDVDQTAFEDILDRVIDPTAALADRILEAAGDVEQDKTTRLLTTLRSLEGPVAVVPHDNPDPDAIASAMGISIIVESVGLRADPCYFGDISHQENRALVNLLEIDMRTPGDALLDEFEEIILVDHSSPGTNDSLAEDTDVAVVIDHHPPRGPIDGQLVDIRPDVGSTSTIIAEYLRDLGIDPNKQLATALLYGILTDTRDFTRGVNQADFAAARDVVQIADESILEKVESPRIGQETMEILGNAIRERNTQGPVLLSCVGQITNRDALSQAAERLLDLEGITIAIVYGFTESNVYLSGRARGTETDLGETLREALDQIGSAGGHADMAGAQLPLGILSEMHESSESLGEVVRAVVTDRVSDALEDAPIIPDYQTGITADGASVSDGDSQPTGGHSESSPD